MKILMVSMSSIHFHRWTKQLEGSGHDIYWVNVFDSNTEFESLKFVNQTYGWRNRIDYPGRYWVKNNLPTLNTLINKINHRKLHFIVKKKIAEIKPDIVHSFILQSGVLPLLDIMQKYPKIKWVYSAWGNDLYFRQLNPTDRKDIELALPRLDYMFADCTRDYFLAKSFGFNGRYLGTFPTGGGYDFKKYDSLIKRFTDKNTIIIKGYQGKLGRCNNVLKAISLLKNNLKDYEIVVFGANNLVKIYAEELGLLDWKNFKLYFHLPHHNLLEIMGKARIYIGNNISDGLPNTLLEAIIMNCFPIQSNPGGATAELVAQGKNGLLIDDPENVEELRKMIKEAIGDKKRLQLAIEHNSTRIKPFLERGYIRAQVLEQYKVIEEEIHSK